MEPRHSYGLGFAVASKFPESFFSDDDSSYCWVGSPLDHLSHAFYFHREYLDFEDGHSSQTIGHALKCGDNVFVFSL